MSHPQGSVVFLTITDFTTVQAPTGFVTLPASTSLLESSPTDVTSISSLMGHPSETHSLASLPSAFKGPTTTAMASFPTPQTQNSLTDKASDNSITSVTIAAVVILGVLYILGIVTMLYFRYKGHCPRCKDVESKLQKWESGDYKFIDKNVVEARDAPGSIPRKPVPRNLDLSQIPNCELKEAGCELRASMTSSEAKEFERESALMRLEGRTEERRRPKEKERVFEDVDLPLRNHEHSSDNTEVKDLNKESNKKHKKKHKRTPSPAVRASPYQAAQHHPEDRFFVVPVSKTPVPENGRGLESTNSGPSQNGSEIRDPHYWSSYSRDFSDIRSLSPVPTMPTLNEVLSPYPVPATHSTCSDISAPFTYSQYMRASYGNKNALQPGSAGATSMDYFDVSNDDETNQWVQEYRRACNVASRDSLEFSVREEARRTMGDLEKKIRKKRSCAYGGLPVPEGFEDVDFGRGDEERDRSYSPPDWRKGKGKVGDKMK